MKKLSKSQVIARANRIDRLLSNKDLKQAFQDVRDAIHESFEKADPEDVDYLIGLKVRLQLLDATKANLESALREGRFEEKQLQKSNVEFLGELRGRR